LETLKLLFFCRPSNIADPTELFIASALISPGVALSFARSGAASQSARSHSPSESGFAHPIVRERRAESSISSLSFTMSLEALRVPPGDKNSHFCTADG